MSTLKRADRGGLLGAERLRVSGVAEMLNVSQSTVRRMVRSGEWAAGRDRRGLWVSHAALLAWLETNQRAQEIRGWWARGRPVRVLAGGRSD